MKIKISVKTGGKKRITEMETDRERERIKQRREGEWTDDGEEDRGWRA